MTHVGIDLHQLESQICVIEETGEVLAESRVRTRRDALEQALAAWPGSQVLVEACNESEWVARHLERCGYGVVVADPNYTPMYGHRHQGTRPTVGMPGRWRAPVRRGSSAEPIGPARSVAWCAPSWSPATPWSARGRATSV